VKRLALIVSIIIVIASVFLCQKIIINSIPLQKKKLDYAELNHVKYGLFSVEEWKRQATGIFSDEINKLYLTKADKRELKKHIEIQLNILIDNIDKKIRNENAGSAKGWVKQTFINIFVSMKDVKEGIPQYADAILEQINKTKNKNDIKDMLKNQMGKYIDQTFDVKNESQLNSVLLRTHSTDIESARIYLCKEIALDYQLIEKEAILLIVLSVTLFFISCFNHKPLPHAQYILLIFSLMLLLISGVTTPMIDMDAKISKMSFILMGHPIHFENQVLYFQSKSILDVFWIMITDKALQMKFVGILMITFSIFIPVFKIISSMGYYYNYRNARKNPVIKFMVFKAGKWSMADVMVIAIFMAYIGFNGIITAQFGQFSSVDQEMVILATNGTCLQPGYYLFFTYVILALFLSVFLARQQKE
jgi:hypothetical protein